MWAETNQIFFPIYEEVAVADHFVASVATAYQQVLGKGQRQAKFLSYLPSAASSKLLQRELGKSQHHADSSDMFLYKTNGILICPYDDRGRLAGEEVWEPEPSEAELIKLDPADVLTTEEAAKLLAPLIKPLPLFDEAVLQRKSVPDKKRAAPCAGHARVRRKSPSRSTACSSGFGRGQVFSHTKRRRDESCRDPLAVNFTPDGVTVSTLSPQSASQSHAPAN
jgi:hypothetical protein